MAIDQWLRHNFWLPTLGLTAIASLFGAKTVANIAAANLVPDEKALGQAPLVVKPSASGLPTATTQHATTADPILGRNPFDSTTGPLNGRPPEDVALAPPPDLSDPFAAPPCDGVKVLIITASSDPDWSFAALSPPGENQKSVLRRRGGEFNGKQVKFIGWDRVWFTNGGQLCQAEMFRPAGAPVVAAAPPPPPPAAAAAGGAGSVPPDIAKGIVRVSATEFNVDRGVVDKILENQAELMRQARIVPEQENGKVVGIRLFGVRPDTLLGTLGMENGDRLQTINGFDMTSPEKALEAYARLRTADHLTIQVNRRGQNMNLDYNIK
jgi:general secretion pathway protein C